MKKATNFLFTCFVLSLAAAGCSSDSGFVAADIIEQTPKGSINGTPFEMMIASVKLDGDELDIELFKSTDDPCAFVPSSTESSVMFRAPNAVGSYPLLLEFSENGRTATFFTPPSQNTIVGEGLIMVDAVSATEVTVGIVAESGSDSVNGRFTATICPAD